MKKGVFLALAIIAMVFSFVNLNVQHTASFNDPVPSVSSGTTL